MIDDAFFHQRRCWTGLYAGAAGNAFGIEKALADAGRNFRLKTAAVDSQCKGALNLVAGAHATRADDALRGVELEIRIAGIDRSVKVVFPVKTVTHVAQADSPRHVLQLAVAVCRTGQAVERMIGDIQLHDVATYFRERRGLRADLHAGLDRRRARCRIAFAAVDFDEAQSARTKRFDAVGGTKLRDIDAGFTCGAQDARTGFDRGGQAINFNGDRVCGVACRCSEVNLSGLVHPLSPDVAKSSAKCLSTLLTGCGVMPPIAQSDACSIVSHSSTSKS